MNPTKRRTRWSVVVMLAMLAPSGVGGAQERPALSEATKSQDVELLHSLLDAGVDVDVPQLDGATALHWAVYHDAPDLLEPLLNAGADVNVVNDYGVTALSLACDNGSAAMVVRLLTAGADHTLARKTGETPLMTCARTGALDAVNALLAHDADPGATDHWHGQTALMWATGEGHRDVVRTLVAGGADPETRSTGGFTALLIAARQDDAALVSVLVSSGADVNATAPDGTTPLHVATVRGHAQLATALLEHGANPNSVGPGYTPLHWAAGSWHTELTGRLRGIDTGGDEEWWSLNGVQTGRLDFVRALLAHGADPNTRLVNGPPQFGFASARFRVSVVGATPYLLAAMDGDVEIMQALAAAGADTTLTTDEHTTPLMVAAGLGQVPAETRVIARASLEAVQLALEHGAHVNAVNDIGRTALHGAAHIRSDAIVQLLVDRGARINVADQRGVTPLMIAEGGGHILLPGLGGGTTAELLRALGSEETVRSSFIENFSQGAIR